MIDLHAFPGGATISSYNMVDPNRQVFWYHESKDHWGFTTWQTLLNWYDKLPSENKDVIF